MWRVCGVAIYQDKAYFCEVAAAMDQLFNEDHSWKVSIDKNPFKKSDSEIAEQAQHFCWRCGWCLASKGNRNQDSMPVELPPQALAAPSYISNSNLVKIRKPNTKNLQNFEPPTDK